MTHGPEPQPLNGDPHSRAKVLWDLLKTYFRAPDAPVAVIVRTEPLRGRLVGWVDGVAGPWLLFRGLLADGTPAKELLDVADVQAVTELDAETQERIFLLSQRKPGLIVPGSATPN